MSFLDQFFLFVVTTSTLLFEQNRSWCTVSTRTTPPPRPSGGVDPVYLPVHLLRTQSRRNHRSQRSHPSSLDLTPPSSRTTSRLLSAKPRRQARKLLTYTRPYLPRRLGNSPHLNSTPVSRTNTQRQVDASRRV